MMGSRIRAVPTELLRTPSTIVPYIVNEYKSLDPYMNGGVIFYNYFNIVCKLSLTNNFW